ncbi:MAG: hypothetical protein AAFZ80_02950 [Cyanobacteria bacterium P01_A01_bin.105]
MNASTNLSSRHNPFARANSRWLRHVSLALLLSGAYSPVVHAQVVDEGNAPSIYNQADMSYQDAADPSDTTFFTKSPPLTLDEIPLVDPLGQVLGCDGAILADYSGFVMTLYEPDASGLGLGNVVTLTGTELPDIPNNGISGGKEPNIANVNPFGLSNADSGRYNFLFDPNSALTSPVNAGLNQTDVGAQYILVISTPPGSIYTERRIKLEILNSTGGVNNNIVRYRATALDGIPLSATGGNQISDTVVEVFNAETEGLNLFSLAFGTVLCEREQIDITKTADRAAAQPGDTVVYRLLIRNLVDADLQGIVANDTLPPGFQLLPESATAIIDGQAVPVTVAMNGNVVDFSTSNVLPGTQSMEIIYAARLTPDALRGSGENIAFVNGQRVDNGLNVQDGPSIHRVVMDPGLLSDCGTLIGRVFVDKNFDGEQQAGEVGIPNAVIFLEDGNRIVTDEDGLYSVACMLPGHHTGVLDLSNLPGYTLAPNLYFNERNSQSRLVHLAPGGMVRMNFGVTPAFQEEGE